MTTTDRAFCGGNGRAGEIGDGKRFLRFWPRAVAGGLSFSRVMVGQLDACGDTTGNRAYCWGYNLNGQLGDGSGTEKHVPTPVAGTN